MPDGLRNDLGHQSDSGASSVSDSGKYKPRRFIQEQYAQSSYLDSSGIGRTTQTMSAESSVFMNVLLHNVNNDNKEFTPRK
ncbi:hypothetical protein HDU99_007062 [Rhizoclosmatium hyalinum]|nr:hypothetical protein HDU99_007062 [Rhizoclosmatium hyalinum]